MLTCGLYFVLPDEEHDFDFEEKFSKLKTEFMQQLKKVEQLNRLILEKLGKIQINENKG